MVWKAPCTFTIYHRIGISGANKFQTGVKRCAWHFAMGKNLGRKGGEEDTRETPRIEVFSPSPIKGKEPPCWTELPSFIVRAGGWWWWCHQRKLHGAFYVTNSGVAWHLLVADSLNEPFALVMPLDNRVAPAAQLVPSFLSLPSSLPSFPLRVNKTRLLPPLFREGIIVKFVGRRRVKSCWSSRGST